MNRQCEVKGFCLLKTVTLSILWPNRTVIHSFLSEWWCQHWKYKGHIGSGVKWGGLCWTVISLPQWYTPYFISVIFMDPLDLTVNCTNNWTANWIMILSSWISYKYHALKNNLFKIFCNFLHLLKFLSVCFIMFSEVKLLIKLMLMWAFNCSLEEKNKMNSHSQQPGHHGAKSIKQVAID